MFDLAAATAKTLARHDAQFPTDAHGPTGPRSPAGKQRARLNAYKHGLTGQIHLFTAEEHAAFEKHCQAIVQALAPVGILEQELAQSIAEDKWRLKRARALETNIFAIGQIPEYDEPEDLALAQAKTWIAQGRNLQLLSLYQQRIERSVERNMAELRTLRAERTATRQHALEEALLLAQLAKRKGEIYHPAADFPSPEFVFSSAEIEWMVTRQERLDEAHALPKIRKTPNPGLKMPAAA